MDILNIDFLNNLQNPVIICNRKGEILQTNFQMNQFLNTLNISNLKTIQEVDLDFNVQEIIVHSQIERTIKIGDVSRKVTIYSHQDHSDIKIFYLFDKTIIEYDAFEQVNEHIDELVVLFDENGFVKYMNSVCDDMLPYTRKNIVGKSIYEITKTGVVSKPIMIDMLISKKILYRNITYTDGHVIAYTAIPLFYSNGELRGGILTGRDITRLIKLENRIQFDTKKPDTTKYISNSKVMKEITEMVIRSASTDSSIFINGESGVGKEIIANIIVQNSLRKDKPFIAINCGAIPNELLESELFGYEEGAFTGAKKGGKVGLLEKVNGGTVFLDEIGELPLKMQTKLLRVIQENRITRIGGSTPINIDIRYISATNISYEDLQKNKHFRRDLYYRLSVIPIKIPPLRERKEDIIPLTEYFLEFYNKKYNRILTIPPNIMNLLTQYDWPGNIRELRNIIERFVVLSANNVLREDELNIFISLDNVTISPLIDKQGVDIRGYTKLNDVYRAVDQLMIPNAIKKYSSINKAATELGINQSTIHRKIKSGHIFL